MFCKKNRMAVWSLCLSVVLLWGLAGCSFSQKDQTEPGSAVQTDTGSAVPTTEAIQPEPGPEPALPASQQESDQHAAVMEDPDAPAYAKEYPTLCRMTDDDECGCLTFEIDKRRFSVRLTKPYTAQRKQSAREAMTALNKRRE